MIKGAVMRTTKRDLNLENMHIEEGSDMLPALARRMWDPMGAPKGDNVVNVTLRNRLVSSDVADS